MESISSPSSFSDVLTVFRLSLSRTSVCVAVSPDFAIGVNHPSMNTYFVSSTTRLAKSSENEPRAVSMALPCAVASMPAKLILIDFAKLSIIVEPKPTDFAYSLVASAMFLIEESRNVSSSDETALKFVPERLERNQPPDCAHCWKFCTSAPCCVENVPEMPDPVVRTDPMPNARLTMPDTTPARGPMYAEPTNVATSISLPLPIL